MEQKLPLIPHWINQTERKFDEMMFDIPSLYISQLTLIVPACKALSNTAYVNPRLYCYEQLLMECISQVEQMMIKVEGLEEEKKRHHRLLPIR